MSIARAAECRAHVLGEFVHELTNDSLDELPRHLEELRIHEMLRAKQCAQQRG
ncbi:hypothetical protein D3C83_51880 [compost metagenome]